MRSQWRARIEQERRNQLLLCRWKLSTVSVRIYLYQHIRSTYNLFSGFFIMFKQKIIDSSRVICISAFNVLYGCYSYYLPVSVSLFSIRNKSVMHWLICFSSRSFLRYSDRLMDKQAATWSNKSSSTSVRRNPIKCLWFSSLSLLFVLILLLPLRLFLPLGVHVFQYRLSLPILEIVLWTPLGGTNRQVKRLLLRGYGEIPIKIKPIGWREAKWQYR